MTIKKFKVIENYSTTEGTLYKGEVLKEDSNNTLEDHKRLKDSMGRVWFVPYKYIVRIWRFSDFTLYLYMITLKRGYPS